MTQPTKQKGVAGSYLVIGIVALLIIGGFIYLGSASDPANDNQAGLDNLANIDIGQEESKVEQIEENPDSWVRQNVSVQGEVATIYGNQSFQLASTDWFENEVLVISKNPLPAQLLEDKDDIVDEEEIVRVDGTVQIMSIVEIEHELGLDLDPQLEIELEDQRPFIMADQVTVLRENAFPDANN